MISVNLYLTRGHYISVLTGTNVSEATDILKLKNLSFFRIADTPLAENEEQLNLIQKQFPELKIETEY